jgi:hypothetical protein
LFNIREIHIFSEEKEVEESNLDVSTIVMLKGERLSPARSISECNRPRTLDQRINAIRAGGI